MAYRKNFTRLIENLLTATQARPLWDIYMASATLAGIAHGVLFSAVSTGDVIVQEATSHTAPPGWTMPKSGRPPQLSNPILAHAMHFRHPFSAAHALDPDGALHPQNGTTYAADQTFILPDFTLPRTVFIYLYGDAVAAAGELRLLHLAGLAMNARLHEIASDQITAPAATLSSREWECLQWASSGKTDWEIGEILHLSDKTVNEYVERAKHKLGVPTRIQAIVEGIRWGAIRI